MSNLKLHISGFDFISLFPNFTKTYRGVKPVEYGQGHGDVGYDRPGPEAVKVQLNGVRLGPTFFERVDGPHCQVRHEEKCHNFPAGLPADLLRSDAAPSRGVQHEHRLTCGLQETRQCRYQD